MKYVAVNQAHDFGPPSSAPKVIRRSKRTAMQPAEVVKNTNRE